MKFHAKQIHHFRSGPRNLDVVLHDPRVGQTFKTRQSLSLKHARYTTTSGLLLSSYWNGRFFVALQFPAPPLAELLLLVRPSIPRQLICRSQQQRRVQRTFVCP